MSSLVWVPIGLIAIRAVRSAQPGHQDSQIIVNLGHRTDGRARRRAQVFLFDGDRWRKSLDVFDARFLQLIDELSRVGTETLDIATLAFGINRVHRQ